MAKQTIEAIREREREAREIEQKARKDAAELIKKAREESEKASEAQIAAAKDQADRMLAEAKDAARVTKHAAADDIKENVEALEKSALVHREDAVRLILSSLSQ